MHFDEQDASVEYPQRMSSSLLNFLHPASTLGQHH